MAKSEVITTVDINGSKITVYVDEQSFYNKVKIELLKQNKSLTDFLQESFAEFVNNSGYRDIKTTPDDPDLKNKVKAIISLKGLTMKDVIDEQMENLIDQKSSLT